MSEYALRPAAYAELKQLTDITNLGGCYRFILTVYPYSCKSRRITTGRFIYKTVYSEYFDGVKYGL